MADLKLNEKQVSFITWGGIVLAIGTIGYFAYHFFKKAPVNETLDDLKNQGKYPTISDAQAQSYADKLDSELDSIFINESVVYSVFSSLQNLSDVLLVISKYGSRLHFAINYFGYFTLPEFMHQRLSTSDITQINSILSAKNINYKF